MSCDHTDFSNSNVVDSRKREEVVWRRRKCKVCGEIFQTEERLIVPKSKRVQKPKEEKQPPKKRVLKKRERTRHTYSSDDFELWDDDEFEMALFAGDITLSDDE